MGIKILDVDMHLGQSFQKGSERVRERVKKSITLCFALLNKFAVL